MTNCGPFRYLDYKKYGKTISKEDLVERRWRQSEKSHRMWMWDNKKVRARCSVERGRARGFCAPARCFVSRMKNWFRSSSCFLPLLCSIYIIGIYDT